MSTEIRPVRKVDGAMEWCEPHEAEVFGVYVRDTDGLAQWVADCATRDDARRMASALAYDDDVEATLETVLSTVLEPAEYVAVGTDRYDVFDVGDLIEATGQLLEDHGDEDAGRIRRELSIDALILRCRKMNAEHVMDVIDEILQRAYESAGIHGGTTTN